MRPTLELLRGQRVAAASELADQNLAGYESADRFALEVPPWATKLRSTRRATDKVARSVTSWSAIGRRARLPAQDTSGLDGWRTHDSEARDEGKAREDRTRCRPSRSMAHRPRPIFGN